MIRKGDTIKIVDFNFRNGNRMDKTKTRYIVKQKQKIRWNGSEVVVIETLLNEGIYEQTVRIPLRCVIKTNTKLYQFKERFSED